MQVSLSKLIDLLFLCIAHNRGSTDTIALFASVSGLIDAGGVIREDGTFDRPTGEGSGGGGKKRSIAASEPLAIKNHVTAFDASILKGRPLL